MFFSRTVMRRRETSGEGKVYTHTHTHTHAETDTLLSFASALARPASIFLLFQPHAFPPCVFSQDAFFYSLVYDPQQKTLLADKGEIRVGNKFQADITDLLNEGTSYLKLWNFN